MAGVEWVDASKPDTRVPVTILTGFLGSGKTTLLNHILTENHGLKFAIIENEFGEVGVDDALIKKQKFQSEEEIIEMNNGCICCTVRGDLIRIIKDILTRRRGVFDAILIETTGLADPAPVAQTFFVDEEITKMCRLDGIITVIDAKHIIQHLEEVKPEGVENESVEQVAFADRLLLNKIDLVSVEEREVIKSKLRVINLAADIIECEFSRVDPKLLMNIQSFSLDRVLSFDPSFLEESEHQHDQSITSVGIRFPEPINLSAFQELIDVMILEKGTDMLRYKGIINVAGMDLKFVFQGVHMIFTGGYPAEWAENEFRENRFIFIGRNLNREEIITQFMSCKAGELRFKVGDRVEAAVTGGFKPGEVIKLWDQGNPYRIRLDWKSREVWGPVDEDLYVRKADETRPVKKVSVAKKHKRRR